MYVWYMLLNIYLFTYLLTYLDDDQDGEFLLVPAHPGSPRERAIERLLYVCMCVLIYLPWPL